MLNGKIFLKGWKTSTIIGIHQEEKLRPQPLILDLEITCDLEQAAKTDNIDYALDYQKLKEDLDKVLRNHSFELVESLGYALSSKVMRYPQVQKVWLKLDKPQALEGVESVGVELVMERKDLRGE